MTTLAVPAVGSDESLMRYARAAGVLMLLSIVFGALGEAYIPGRIIVDGDATATAANILNHPTLFRLGFASYVVEGICDIALAVVFYVLLRPVDRNLALLAAFFGIASMVTFAVAQSAYFASSLIVRETAGMESFTAEQRNALALLSLRISATIGGLFLALYGIATMIRGFLIMRSRYFPGVFGVLFIIGGAGFFLRTVTFILAPAYSSYLLLLPMAAAGIPFMLWLLIRGVKPVAIARR
ncbi:MAG: DUF4386 domain-containing protein [Gemmatimonadaceae bacterium]